MPRKYEKDFWCLLSLVAKIYNGMEGGGVISQLKTYTYYFSSKNMRHPQEFHYVNTSLIDHYKIINPYLSLHRHIHWRLTTVAKSYSGYFRLGCYEWQRY